MSWDEPEAKPEKPEPKNLEVLSIEALGEYIEELEAEIARVRAAIALKRDAKQGAESVFKS